VRLFLRWESAFPVVEAEAWHYWNIVPNSAKPRLTAHILREGNVNLAYFDFKVAP
jgi:hypothetical protein